MKKCIIALLAMCSLYGATSAVLPPKFLEEKEIAPQKVSEKETVKALSQLTNGSMIAIRSIETGGYLFADDKYFDEQILSSLIQRSGGWYLAYSYTTPDPTRFIIERTGNVIRIKSLYFEGHYLTEEDGVTKFTDKKDMACTWSIQSAQGLDQVSFKNNKSGKYLSMRDITKMESDKKDDKRPPVGAPVKINHGVVTKKGPAKKTDLFKIRLLIKA